MQAPASSERGEEDVQTHGIEGDSTHVMLHQVRQKLVKGWNSGALEGMGDETDVLYRDQENIYGETDDMVDAGYDADESRKHRVYTPNGPPLHSPDSSSAENSPHPPTTQAPYAPAQEKESHGNGEGTGHDHHDGGEEAPAMNIIAQMSGQTKAQQNPSLLKVLAHQSQPTSPLGTPPKAPGPLHRRSMTQVPSIGPREASQAPGGGIDHLSLSNVVKDKYVQRLESKVVELQQRLNETVVEEGARVAMQQMKHDLDNRNERVRMLEKENEEMKSHHRKVQSWSGIISNEMLPGSPASDMSTDDETGKGGNAAKQMDVDGLGNDNNNGNNENSNNSTRFWERRRVQSILGSHADDDSSSSPAASASAALARALEQERERSAALEDELNALKRQQMRRPTSGDDAQMLKDDKEALSLNVVRLEEALASKEKENRNLRERSQAMAESMKRLAAESDQKTSSMREKLNKAVRMGKEVVVQRDQLRSDVAKLVTEYEKLQAEKKNEEVARQQAEADRKVFEERVDALVSEISTLMTSETDEKVKQLMLQLHRAQQKAEFFQQKATELKERAELLELNLEGAEERSEWLAAEGERRRERADALGARVKSAEVETSRAMVESERANRRIQELEKQLVEVEKQLQREEEKAETAKGKAQAFQVKLGMANQTKADLAVRLEEAEGRADLAEGRAGSLLGIANQRAVELAAQLQQASERAKAAEARAEVAERRANHLHDQLVTANQRQVELANRLRVIESRMSGRGGAAGLDHPPPVSEGYSPRGSSQGHDVGMHGGRPSTGGEGTGFFRRTSMLSGGRRDSGDGEGIGGDERNPLKRLIGKGPEIKESLKQGVKNFWAEIKGDAGPARDPYGRRDSGEHHMRRESGDNHRRESGDNL